jgi:hypothetical protein
VERRVVAQVGLEQADPLVEVLDVLARLRQR